MKKYRHMEFVGLMKELIKLFEPKVYVEIGVQRGYTFHQIAPLVKRAIGVDINPIPPGSVQAETFLGTSRDFAMSLHRNKQKPFIDLLFIDGDHHKEAVLDDVTMLFPFVMPWKGLILLHDTHPVVPELLRDGYCSSAWEAAWEIRKSEKFIDFECLTLPGPWAGMTILRYAPRHLWWMK